MDGKRIQKLLNAFGQISGMEIAILDDKLHALYSYKHHGESFCSEIHKCVKCLKLCQLSDAECTKRAKDAGSAIIYTCRFGIKEAVIPIVQNEKVVAYLLCSLGLCSQENDNETPINIALSECPSLNKKVLESAVAKLPRNDNQKIEAYFDLLKTLAAHLSVNARFNEHAPTIGELIKNFINNNLSRKITLSDLSYHIHYSKATLTEHFRKEFGISIVNYITIKRIELAKKLLLETDKTLNEISVLCGFDDTEYFSKTFKKFNSLPPATWRKSNLR